MDPVIVGSVGVIVLMAGVIFFILSSGSTPQEARTKSKETKQREVIDGYKAQLDVTLEGLSGDALEQARRKALTAISQELSRNLFFDHDEMREAVAELARHTPARSE